MKNLSKGVTRSELYGVADGKGLSPGSQEAATVVHETNGDDKPGKCWREWGEGGIELFGRQGRWTE